MKEIKLLIYVVFFLFVLAIVGKLFFDTLDNFERIIIAIPWYLYIPILIIGLYVIINIVDGTTPFHSASQPKDNPTLNQQQKRPTESYQSETNSQNGETQREVKSIWDESNFESDSQIVEDMFANPEKWENVYMLGYPHIETTEKLFERLSKTTLRGKFSREMLLYHFGFISLPKYFHEAPNNFIALIYDTNAEWIKQKFVYESLNLRYIPSGNDLKQFRTPDKLIPIECGIIIKFPEPPKLSDNITVLPPLLPYYVAMLRHENKFSYFVATQSLFKGLAQLRAVDKQLNTLSYDFFKPTEEAFVDVINKLTSYKQPV